MIKKLLSKTKKEFISVPYDKTDYKTVLQINDTEKIILEFENLLSIYPIIYGFLSNKSISITNNDIVNISIYYKNKKLSIVKLRFQEKTQIDSNNFLYLFESKSAEIIIYTKRFMFLYNMMLFVKKRSNTELTFSQNNQIISFFSVPRKVYLCSFTSEKNKSVLFPIDLVIENQKKNTVIFSIRKSNINVLEIIKEKTITLIPADYNHKEIIFKLGKYHSTEFPRISKLEFNTYKSTVFNHPVPFFLKSYLELEIINYKSIGSQMLYISKIKNQKFDVKKTVDLALIHSVFK